MAAMELVKDLGPTDLDSDSDSQKGFTHKATKISVSVLKVSVCVRKNEFRLPNSNSFTNLIFAKNPL